MIAANTAIFHALDEYCLRFEQPLSTAGRPRWITTTTPERYFLKEAKLGARLQLSASLSLARFDLDGHSYFLSSGFEMSEIPDPLQAAGVDGGVLTAFLAELGLAPSATPTEVRNIIDIGDQTSTPGYAGHDPLSICSLYPKIQVLKLDNLLPQESFKIFFLICLFDKRCLQQWIDTDLFKTLSLLTVLDPSFVPYRILCNAVLEIDPTALFLAFYRCLEALYAHTQTHRLMTEIGVKKPWTDMAQTLETVLGWYPREESSLEALLSHAVLEDLRSVAASLDSQIEPDSRPAAHVARKVYQLRNAVVHYRPFHQKFSYEKTNWNRLCEAMALLVLHVYGEVSTAW